MVHSTVHTTLYMYNRLLVKPVIFNIGGTKIMTDELLDFSFTNVSSFYGVIATLCCFIVMVIWILRLNEENLLRNFRGVTRCEDKIESPVQSILNPFSVQLSSELTHLDISLQKPCLLYLYWGTVITEFFSEIHKPWTEILDLLQSGEWLREGTLFIDGQKQFNAGKHSVQLIRPPEVTGEMLGLRPRSRYPAIVIMVVDNALATSYDLQIVAMFTVIHVQDTVCNSESHIMYQYLKTSDNCVTTLQPLFVATSMESLHSGEATSGVDNSSREHQIDSDENTVNKQQIATKSSTKTRLEEPTTEDRKQNVESENCYNMQSECIVCQNSSVTIAILPCRHTCVCDKCFLQLDKCPMCRGYIYSYFRIQEHSNGNSSIQLSDGTSDEGLTETRIENRWQYINRRLNEFLGFQ